MVETLHPDVFTIERGGQPTIVGASTSTVGFVGTSRRGPADRLGFVTSYTEFRNLFGEGFPDSFLEDAVFFAFQNGAARIFCSRVLGAGAAKATNTLPALAGAPAAAVIDGSGTGPFNLEPADTISISVDGGLDQDFVFAATRAIYVAGGPAVPPPGAADTLVVSFDGGPLQTVTFAGTEATADAIAGAINAQVEGGRAVNVGGTLQLESDTRGTGSAAAVDVTSSAGGLTATGFVVGGIAGTGNVVNIDAVTIAEVIALLSTLAGATASNNAGAVRITHDTAGALSTIEVTAAPAVFGFPGGAVAGVDSAGVPMLTVNAINEGAWGDGVTVSTLRWGSLSTEILAAADTTLILDDVSRVELGDIVVISDGTTQHIAHINGVDIGTKEITFTPANGGTPISTGATVRSASSHRTRTEVRVATSPTDTVVSLNLTNQIRIGTELSFDDGTTLTFRRVTRVNGNDVTLDAAIGTAYAIGTLVATQHFDLTVAVDGTIDTTHRFLSLVEADEQDFVEIRLFGLTTNESDNIEVLDLDPAIAIAIEDHIAPVTSVALTGGLDGAPPIDNDFIGQVEPPTALQLFTTLNPGDINIVAIPGITTVAVQQALSDFVETNKGPQGQKAIALIDGPLTADEPLEIRDWRLNQHNRDTSYSALYYPWLVVRDRLASVSGATKQIPPSGPVAGLYGRVDTEVGVWEAPANRVLIGVQDTVFPVSDGQWDLLNPIGINVIRFFPGEGIRVMGARTLTNTFDGRHYVNVRRLLNFDKISISRALRQFLFRGITLQTFSEIERAITFFHRTIWRQGGLFPANNFNDAQFVKCDEENNPLESRKLGQLFVDAGINPPFPAEFIIFTIGLFDGETAIDETTAG